MKEYCNSRLCCLPGISASSSNPLPEWRTVYSKSGASCFKPTVHIQHGWRASVTELLQNRTTFSSSLHWIPLHKRCGNPVPRYVFIQSVWIPEYSPSEGFAIQSVSLRLTKQVTGPVFHYGEQFLILFFRVEFHMRSSKRYPSCFPLWTSPFPAKPFSCLSMH